MAEADTPRKEAVAIRYDSKEDTAPKVVAKGAGQIAEHIVAAAEKHAVPVYQNRTLTAMLMAVELDREIPPALYKAVAEVLAYVYRLDQKRRKR
jgi:flagellar biosynthesis protein